MTTSKQVKNVIKAQGSRGATAASIAKELGVDRLVVMHVMSSFCSRYRGKYREQWVPAPANHYCTQQSLYTWTAAPPTEVG